MEEEGGSQKFDQDLNALIASTGYDVYRTYEEASNAVKNLLKPEEVIIPDAEKETKIIFPPIPEDVKDQCYDTLKTDIHTMFPIKDLGINPEIWLEKFPEATKKRTSDVLFLQNGSYDSVEKEFNGYSISVVLVTTPLPIPTKAFHPDRMFYGMLAIPIPYPDMCDNASKKFYDASQDEIKEVIDSIDFTPERNTDFIGVFKEHHLIGNHFRERRWIIVQLGDEEESATLYEMMISSRYQKKCFYNLYKDGTICYKTFQRKVKEKRIDIADKLLSKFEMSYDMLKKSDVLIIDQEEHSLYTLFDNSIFCVAKGSFHCESKPFMIWKGHTQGFTFFQTGPSLEVHSKFLHAIPYDTGLNIDLAKKTFVPETLYGDTSVVDDTVMMNMDTEFLESLARIGINPAAQRTNVIPMCVKLFKPKDIY